MTIQNARFPIVAGCIFAVDAYPYTDEDQHSGDPMTHLYYRPTTTMDPEERLEDAALHKALHDTFGKGLTILATEDPAPEDGLFLGRGKMGEWGRTNIMGSPDLRYWEDPAFRDAITRSFKVTDLAGAEAEVSRLHEAGHDAFLKSTRQKHYTGTVPRGTTLHQALGAMAFSFMDRDNCLMVQEAVKMKYERRFLIMNGDVVTQSPVAWHLTPMSRARDETGLDIEDMHFETPRSNAARFSPKGRERMTEVARAVAAASETPHLCIDLAIMGDDPETDPIEVIEFNPMQPGGVGLYACDPVAIATAIWKTLDPELCERIAARRAGEEDVFPDGPEEAENAGEGLDLVLGDEEFEDIFDTP